MIAAHEKFALDHYFSDWDANDDADFKDVLAHFLDEPDEFVVWQPFEDHPIEEVADLISDMAYGIAFLFEPRKKS